MKRIYDLDNDDALKLLLSICNRIYIARNITQSPENIEAALAEIDLLLRDENYN